MKTKHSNEAVDRYIRDYQRVQIRWQNHITNLDQISQLTRLSKRVVSQYVDLLPDKLKSISKNESDKNVDLNTKNVLVNKEP